MQWYAVLTRFGWLVGILLAGRLTAQTSTRPRCESVQLRFVDETPAHGALGYRDRGTGKLYALTDTVVLDGRGLQDVYIESWAASPHDTLWTVIATVKPASADSLSATLARHLKHRIAVLIGDEIVETAVVEGPLHAKLPLRIQVSKPIADSLVLRLRRATATTCE
jgi:preprotein translocase subunit SecD